MVLKKCFVCAIVLFLKVIQDLQSIVDLGKETTIGFCLSAHVFAVFCFLSFLFLSETQMIKTKIKNTERVKRTNIKTVYLKGKNRFMMNLQMTSKEILCF